MKVTGTTFIRNVIVNDYPVAEAIRSVLPLRDDFVVAFLNSTDETAELTKSISPDKIKIINTVWHDALQKEDRYSQPTPTKHLKPVMQ